MTDSELQEAVRYWWGRKWRDLTCREEEQQEAVMREAVERFGETSMTGAMAQLWLLRAEGVRLITEKNRAKIDLEHAEKRGEPKEKIDERRARYEPLAEQVEEIKLRVRYFESLLRKHTASRLGVKDPLE